MGRRALMAGAGQADAQDFFYPRATLIESGRGGPDRRVMLRDYSSCLVNI
jgi:hypothetical protein